jgi:two-component system sensor histidine kinase/response regulator
MILIVDDSPENIISLKKVLEKNGFVVDSALSGEEALKKVLKNSYILIILDVQMPGMDGFEVAQAISGYSKASETAIIFLSAANTDTKFIAQGYSSGGLDYITKPVDINILLLKVKVFYRIYEQSHKLIEMQKELLEEIESRKEAEHKKDEFISIASHELKTPLTSIKGYLQLLSRSVDKENMAPLKHHLDKVHNQVEKLNVLVADLLDISKIEGGKLKFNMGFFSIDKLLQDVIEVTRQTNPGFTITINGVAGEQMFSDEMRLEQVITNFLTNAVKYSPGTNKIDVTISVCDNTLYLAVKDFGIGMPEEHLQQVFEKFYRVEKTSLRFQGLGIGLYISKQIIERLGGEIGVNSKLGQGSEFYFYLPMHSPQEENI